ncbi:MAG: hypothetical protein JNK82_26320, partial [Myxococcaceae bacterium]|nr:hypothetical protein [Myxococcaceae bacterium]
MRTLIALGGLLMCCDGQVQDLDGGSAGGGSTSTAGGGATAGGGNTATAGGGAAAIAGGGNLATAGGGNLATAGGGSIATAGGGMTATAGGGAAPGPVLAFPGAEGFGARMTGGRGGRVIKVTTLSATGPGSLDAALRAAGPRIIVFTVSGLINGDFDITEPNVTIAGQTAPGAGITIVGRLWAPFSESDGSSRVNNLIIRHLRVRHVCRPGTPDSQCDAVRLSSQSRFILDHVSFSWGIDETLDMWGGAHDWTIQDSTFEHPCLDSNGSASHAYGMLNRRGGRASVLRTGMLTVRDRNPALADGPFDVINMFVFNHQTGLTHHNPASGAFNVIGNYYRSGASGGIAKPFWLGGSQTSATDPQYWFADNYLDQSASAPFGAFNDPWTASHGLLGGAGMGNVPTTNRAPMRHDFSSYSGWVAPTVVSAVAARDLVLNRSGAWPRDVVTRDAVTEARNRTGAFGCAIRNQLDAQGNFAGGPHPLMAGLTVGTPPADADNDGMADAWESTHGLSPANGNDHAT